MRRALFPVSALLLLACGEPSGPAPEGLEGEVCSSARRCEEGLACVARVGAEYGRAAGENVCERPRAVYDFLHFGERGADRRIDEALAMLDGVYRLPRMPEADANLATQPHELVLADGVRVDCSSVPAGGARADCLVPDWTAYLGDNVPKYSRFILFGLRITGSLIYVHGHASDARLRARLHERTGSAPSAEQLERLRQDARNGALAVLDSFVRRGHRTFALAALPDCYAGTGGYQNPNASWAAELDQWDPALALRDGRLVTADDVPIECTGGASMTFLELRDSLWDRHATAYRAISLASSYQVFRGLLPAERRRAWLRVLRETGDALALPSSYEPGNNHGITEAVALMQLGHDLAGADAELLPRRLTEAWIDLGRHRLNDAIVDTVFPDGVQVEQSPFYHDYQLGLMLFVVRWLRRSGLDLTSGIDARYARHAGDIPSVERRDFDAQAPAPAQRDINQLNPSGDLDVEAVLDDMARAALHLAQPDGWIPMIGSSLPQRLRGYNAAAFEPYLEGDSRAARELLYFWSAGERGEPPPADERLAVFGNSGFVTMHSAWTPHFQAQTHVVFNAGLPYHRHSHADALSVHLYGLGGTASESGMPLLIDSGWYSYRAPGRHYFESTAAHDTVVVDGLNQCTRTPVGKRAGPYLDQPLEACTERQARAAAQGSSLAWPGQVARGLSAQSSREDVPWTYQSAVHGLYEGVAHRRAVVLIGYAILVIIDELKADEAHDFAQTWQLAPEVSTFRQRRSAERGTHHLFFRRGGDTEPTLLSLHEWGGPGELAILSRQGVPPIDGVPGLGWHSTAEEQMQPHLTLQATLPPTADATFASVFLLGELASRHAELSVSKAAPDHLALSMTWPDTSIRLDITALAAGAPAERAALRARGRIPDTPTPGRAQ